MLDRVDARLLTLLQADSGLSLQELGEAVGLTAPAVHQRVKKLESRGVIRGYHARLDPAAVGRGVLVYLRVTPAAGASSDALVEGWKHSSDVLECHRMSRDGGFLLKLRLATPAAVTAHLDALRRAGCVVDSESALESIVERWALGVAAAEA